MSRVGHDTPSQSTLRSEEGHPVEQIDGALEADGPPYLVEIKSWGAPVENNTMSRHLVRV